MAMELKYGDWVEPHYAFWVEEYRLWNPGTRKEVAVGDFLRMTIDGVELLKREKFLAEPKMASFFPGGIKVEVMDVSGYMILVRVVNIPKDAEVFLCKSRPLMGETFRVSKGSAAEWFYSDLYTPLRCESLGGKKTVVRDSYKEPYRFRMDSLGNEPKPFVRKKKKRKQWM